MEKPTTVVILQSTDEDSQRCKRMLENDFAVLCATIDYESALEVVNSSKPDFVISSLMLRHVDGFSVIGDVKALSPQTKCIVFDYSNSDEVISFALRSGADLYAIQPVDYDAVKKRMNNKNSFYGTDTKSRVIGSYLKLISGGAGKTPSASDFANVGVKEESKNRRSGDESEKGLDLYIGRFFVEMGISPNIKGFGYLRSAIKYTMADPQVISSITKELYPLVAEEYVTTPSKVERAIRHALEVAWNKGKAQRFNELLGVQAFNDNERPTNSEFIALVADRLMLREASAS